MNESFGHLCRLLRGCASYIFVVVGHTCKSIRRGESSDRTATPGYRRDHAPSDTETLRIRRWRPTVGPALFLLDALLAGTTWPFAAALAVQHLPPQGQPGLVPLLLYPATYLVFLYALGLYRRDALTEARRSLGRAPLAAGFGGLVASAAVALLPPPLGGPGSPILFAIAVPCFTAAGFTARAIVFALQRRGAFRRRLLVIGAGRRAWDLVWLLRKEGRTPVYDIAIVHDPAMGEVDPRLATDPANHILPAAAGFLAAAQRFRADQVVVAPDERRGMAMRDLLACRTAGFPVAEYLGFLENEIGRVDLKRLELGWLLYADGFAAGPLDHVLKRALDIGVSLAVLLLTSPILLAAAAVVKLGDGGPVLYRQERVTRGGRVFRIMKLRTMRVDAERAGAVWAAERDPRVTRAGRLLRRSRIDELPQLFNVLNGDMSFVGPRPERPEFTRELATKLPLYNERHLVRAGLTGWAQVNYPYGASLDDARSKLSYDLYYVKNAGVLFDLLIILQTFRVVLWPSGVR
ncbi:TIGR03013 family XrtA/PEP-CTERM system glycosyltransferase [Siccirubricoccus sp. G192]|uniref:TIGR03013 family XrtA/PEP-CTERM system glycosyltransferase n=1 Tax=Siccirubricoccus sp. G192 TaxID=2849651 RepID=UPI001C2C23D4|nr:TIGR03013 family XrtA/PEP-CTERM system glycosyltransferase [Siccirubricoccus sp. G192]MBV1795871.1 TIGR03013 family PEP-CTERM/XrtA system glycosyltransferase [Siccirubricoccus sp. G192]